MVSNCLKCQKIEKPRVEKKKDNRIMLSSSSEVCGNKQLKFIK